MELSALDLLWAMKRGIWWDDTPNVKMVQPSGAAPTWDTTRGGWSFLGNADRALWFIIQLSHMKRLSTAVVPHVHWQPTTTSTDVVRWDLKYWYMNHEGGGAQDATGTTITINATPNGTAYEPQVDDFAAVSAVANEEVSAFVYCELSRIGSSDANNDAALLKDFDAHMQKNALGSIAMHSKWG